jgi:hypothetical protein
MSAVTITKPSRDSASLWLTQASDEIDRLRRREEDAHEEARRKAAKAGQREPLADLPRAESSKWVRTVAKILRDVGDGALDGWLTHEVVQATFGEGLVDHVLDRLRAWPEFEHIEHVGVQIRWSLSAMTVRDVVEERAILGRVKVIPLAERLTWAGDGEVPWFRLDLSLPCAILAETDELERHLHHLLAHMATTERGPVLRKPDVVGFASTLGRFGIESPREAQAVAHAMRHPTTTKKLAEFGYDPKSGQGLLWSPQHPRQGDLRDVTADA